MGILEGIRVFDFGHYIAGPFCAALLADLGADVVRVERPQGGDDRFLMPATADGVGAMFLQASRGTRAITLEYGTPQGREVVRRLIAGSDIVVANFSIGALRHFGLDYETLKTIKPDIILTTIGAFDKGTDVGDAVGFDGVGQAISGAIYLTGEPGRPYRSATSYVDFSTAVAAAFGTLAAVIRKMRTGEGGEVEATLAGTALNIMNPILIEQVADYRAEPNLTKLSFSATVIVKIALDSQSEDALDAFEKAVVGCPSVLRCQLMSGSDDYVLTLRVSGLDDFADVHRRELSRLPRVARMESSFALRDILDRPVPSAFFNRERD